MTITLVSQSGTSRRGWLSAFLKFGGLSGAGWLLDFALLLSMVGVLGMPPLLANIVSSCTAARTVVRRRRRFIFDGKEGALGTRIAVYLLYQLCLITVAAWVLALLIGGLGALAQANGFDPSPAALTAAAKVLVTPPQLLLNFLMSRTMSERTMARRT